MAMTDEGPKGVPLIQYALDRVTAYANRHREDFENDAKALDVIFEVEHKLRLLADRLEKKQDDN
jgi:hypothetical protein